MLTLFFIVGQTLTMKVCSCLPWGGREMGIGIEDVTGVLLAGGKSRRMGRDKRFISLQGVTLFERVRSVLEDLFEEMLIVCGQDAPALPRGRGQILFDRVPDCAAAGGLYTGLACATHNRVFAVACDMPFLNRNVISYLSAVDTRADVLMVRLGDALQPLHGFYSKRCLPYLEEMITAGTYRIQDLTEMEALRVNIVQESDVRFLDQQLSSFLNLNTPADLGFAQKRLSSS